MGERWSEDGKMDEGMSEVGEFFVGLVRVYEQA